MSEDGLAPPPQVFVVDSQASYISMPSGKKSRWAKEGQKFLLLLLGLSMLGVLVEGYLIYILYQRTEVRRMSLGVSAWMRGDPVGLDETGNSSAWLFAYVLLRHPVASKILLGSSLTSCHVPVENDESVIRFYSEFVLPFSFYLKCRHVALTPFFWNTLVYIMLSDFAKP